MQAAPKKGGQVVTNKTKPPARFTEASLIREFENRGIGRPSTYAALLDDITGRQYLKLEKRFPVPTATGEKVVDELMGRFRFMDYGFTKLSAASLFFLLVVAWAERRPAAMNGEAHALSDP